MLQLSRKLLSLPPHPSSRLRSLSTASQSLVKSLNPHSGAQLSPSEFNKSYLGPQKPGLFRKLVDPDTRDSSASSNPYGWPSVQAWDHQGNETLSGMRNHETEEMIVPVEIGKPNRGYMEGHAHADKRDGSPGWDSIEMPFGETNRLEFYERIENIDLEKRDRHD